jgi:hypothetical protein
MDGAPKSLSVTDFMASVIELGLKINCTQCTSPGILELSNLLSSQKGTEAVTNLANRAFGLAKKLIEGNFLQVAFDRALNNAKVRCPHSPDYNPDFKGVEYAPFARPTSNGSVSFFVALIIVAVSLFVVVMAVVVTTKVIVRRRHRKWVASLPRSQLQMLWRDQHSKDDEDAFLNEATVSMFRSDVIPSWLRMSMPVIIIGNIGLFLSGHLNLGATVTILASLGGQTIKEGAFFELSLARSTIEIWNGE